MAIVLEHFDVSEKGIVVMIDAITPSRMGGDLLSIIKRSDGSTTSYVSDRAFIVTRNEPAPVEYQCFLLHGGTKHDIPIGSNMDIGSHSH